MWQLFSERGLGRDLHILIMQKTTSVLRACRIAAVMFSGVGENRYFEPITFFNLQFCAPPPPPPRGGPLRLKTQLRGRRSGILAPHKPRWELYTRCGHERFETNYLQARPFIRAVRHTSVVG